MDFLDIATATATPLIREAFRVRHNIYITSEEDKNDPQVLFATRLRRAMERHIKARGLEPHLGAVFDLLDTETSGTLSLEVQHE